MVHCKTGLVIALACGALLVAPAMARDRLITDPDSPYFLSDTDQTAADPNQNFVLRGGIGYASLTAHEHVYAGASGSENVSLLLWQSSAPLANVDVKVRLPDAWTLRGHIDAAIAGDSTMADYDWTGFSPSYNFNDWDHRSISPNTSLDWYLKGDIAFGRDLPINDVLTVNVNGGFGYTDVQWTAVGGSFIYSDITNGFRGTTGTFADVPGIRYRQQFPTLFAGFDTSINDGRWSMEAGARAGLIIYGQSVDHHYMRTPPMYITDNLTFGQVLTANVKLDYNITDHLGLYVDGSYEKMFAGHTISDYRQISNNALLIHSDNIGGGELDVWSITGGVKGYF
jgi:outer membrane protease